MKSLSENLKLCKQSTVFQNSFGAAQGKTFDTHYSRVNTQEQESLYQRCVHLQYFQIMLLCFSSCPPLSELEFLISEYSPKHCGLPVFHFCQASGFKRTFHCGFNLHFSDLMRLSIFSYVYWHLCYYYLFLNFANLIYKK